MRKIALPFLLLPLLFLSGCDLSQSQGSAGGVLRSTDKGKTWEAKVNAGENKNISSLDILSMAVDSQNSQVVYIGTKKYGIFTTRNSAETWEKLDFPLIKVYGLAINPSNASVIYASGVWQGRGKIYKSENKGIDWKEIYTEPADGTVITSLAVSQRDIQTLYAGTSEGALFKTMDGGNSWKNIFKARAAITEIDFDFSNDSIVYFEVFSQGILRTKDGGGSMDDITENIKKAVKNSKVFSVAVDPSNPGILYAGLSDGIVKSSDFGDNWKEVNVLESSKKFPVRAIAINPKNSDEIIYSAAQAVYKSSDGGKQWSTFQLETDGIIGVIEFDPLNPNNLYAGLRKVK